MKLNKTKSSAKFRRLSLVALLTATLLAAALLLYYKNISSPSTSINNDPSVSPTADDSSLSAKKNSSTSQSSTTQVQTPSSVTDDYSIGAISLSQANGIVSSSATVNAPEGGTCSFTYSATDTPPVIRNTSLTTMGSVSKCQSEIAEMEFSKLGTWKLTITYIVNEKMTQESSDVTIR